MSTICSGSLITTASGIKRYYKAATLECASRRVLSLLKRASEYRKPCWPFDVIMNSLHSRHVPVFFPNLSPPSFSLFLSPSFPSLRSFFQSDKLSLSYSSKCIKFDNFPIKNYVCTIYLFTY